MKAAPLAGIRSEMNAFLGAVMFLTRVPVDAWHEYRAEDAAHTAVYFPMVGALVGVCGSLVLFLVYSFLPTMLTVLVVMAVMLLLTGGLHEDGLADTADGLAGGRDVERRLEIMKDSRIGTYGALALWFVLTAKLLLLNTMLARSPILVFCALVAANALGRMSAVALLYFCRYVRAGGSKSSPFGNAVSLKQFLLAGLFTMITVIVAVGPPAGLCFLTALLITCSARFYFQSKLGGITGDCLGANNQIVELGCYAVLMLQNGAAR